MTVYTRENAFNMNFNILFSEFCDTVVQKRHI